MSGFLELGGLIIGGVLAIGGKIRQVAPTNNTGIFRKGDDDDDDDNDEKEDE